MGDDHSPPSRLLQAVTSAIANLLRNQKLETAQIRTYLRDIAEVLKDGLSIEIEGSGACATFVIAAMQMVMEDRKRDGTLVSLLSECCSLLNHSFEYLERAGYRSPSITWTVLQTEFAVISSMLMKKRSDKSSLDAVSVKSAVDAMNHLVIYSHPLSPNLFSSQCISTYGVVLAASLEVYGSDNWTTEIRLVALSTIKQISSNSESAESLSCLIPGLISSLHSLLTTATTTSSIKLLQESLKAYACAVSTVYSLDRKTEETPPIESPSTAGRSLRVKRDAEWWSTLEIRIVQSITKVAAALASHRSEDVRLILLSTVAAVWNAVDKDESAKMVLNSECITLCSNSPAVSSSSREALLSTVIDLLLVLSEDDDEKISTACSDFLSSLPSSSLIDSCHQKLEYLASNLSVLVRNGDGDKQLFAKMSSIINVLGQEIIFLAETEDEVLERFVRSLIDSLRIDSTRLSIVRSEDNDEKRRDPLKETVLSLPLHFGIRMEWMEGVMRALTTNGGEQILRLLLHLLPSSSSTIDSPISASLLILISITLLQKDPVSELNEEHDNGEELLDGKEDETRVDWAENIDAVIEWCCQRLTKVRVTTTEREDVVHDAAQFGSNPTVAAVSLLAAAGAAAAALSRLQLQQGRKTLIPTLSTLLEWSSCPIVIVSESASTGLSQIAEANTISLSALLARNARSISNKVALGMRRYYSHRTCPLILSSLLDRLTSCEDEDLFHHLSLIVQDLLGALDRHNVDWCLLILQVLSSYTRAINRWFPQEKPPSEANEQEKEQMESEMSSQAAKPQPPMSVAMAESILKRTKHLHSSLNLPVCVLSLSIAGECLVHIRHWPDLLLPMVHQNWQSLRPRFDDSNFECRIAALKVLERMSEASTDFIHRKIKEELWPSLENFLRSEATARNSFELTKKHKYTVTLLESLPLIFDRCDLRDDLTPILAEFCTQIVTRKCHTTTVLETAKRTLNVLGPISS